MTATAPDLSKGDTSGLSADTHPQTSPTSATSKSINLRKGDHGRGGHYVSRTPGVYRLPGKTGLRIGLRSEPNRYRYMTTSLRVTGTLRWCHTPYVGAQVRYDCRSRRSCVARPSRQRPTTHAGALRVGHMIRACCLQQSVRLSVSQPGTL